MGEIAISLKNVSKCYKRYAQPVDRLKDQLLPGKSRADEFWALRDINLEIFTGQTLGIIGKNGSGKSTLLQIITGTLTPTTGEVQINGRVSALLELGSGFNPEFTGCQNVFFNGRLLGLTKEQIEAKFEDIVAFADIGDFLDQPVKTYSSGMMARLAFAVQAHLSPDILIIDEALSVGDIFFQQKCSVYLEKLRQQGVTLLLVSHDMNVMQTLCRESVLLNRGEMVYLGETHEAISKYYTLGSGLDKHVSAESFGAETESNNGLVSVGTKEFLSRCQWVYNLSEKEDEPLKARILGVHFQNEYGQDTLSFRMGDRMTVQLLIEGGASSVSAEAVVTLRNRFDQVVFCGGSYSKGINPPKLDKNQQVFCTIDLELGIEAGEYTIDFSIGELLAAEPNKGLCLHKTQRIGPILVQWKYEQAKAPFLGLFNMPCNVKYQQLD